MKSSHLVVVAIGSNLGDSLGTIRLAMARLQSLSPKPLLKSSLWRTEPIDCPPGSPAFINAVVAFEPLAGETPETLLTKLQHLEAEFGRRPKQVSNEARPLDLDLIAFGNETRSSPGLTLPHPRADNRKFVLCPLNEIAPSLLLPGHQNTVAELLAAFPPGQDVEKLLD